MTSKELQEALQMPKEGPNDLPVVLTYYKDGTPTHLVVKHVHRVATCSVNIPGVPKGSMFCSIVVEDEL